MRRSRTILAAGIIGLALGCRHTQPQPEGCSTFGNPPPAGPATAAPQKLTLNSRRPLFPANIHDGVRNECFLF